MRILSILLLCGLVTLPARAADEIHSPAERILLIQRATAGDLQAAEQLDTDGEAGRWDLLYRGYALAAADRSEEAVETWERAVELGHKLAVRALAAHQYEAGEWIEAYAWARLAMEIDAALADANMADLRTRWSLYTAVQAADNLEADRHAEADALARERVERHLAGLIDPEDVGSQGYPRAENLEIVKRTAPRYPRAMAENGMPGWVYLQFEILPNGRVGEVAAVGASHQRFARAAVRAIRKWRFDTDAMETVPAIASQLIDFNRR